MAIFAEKLQLFFESVIGFICHRQIVLTAIHYTSPPMLFLGFFCKAPQIKAVIMLRLGAQSDGTVRIASARSVIEQSG